MSDQEQRQQALNPSLSFIVQAPAGSGKTELLIQRYLSLLATVDYPEEIFAITFTKKAANEMRERLMTALTNAILFDEPNSDHGKTTYQLAKAALARNQLQQWDLLKNPNRLKIQTIDALNYRLNKQLPIISGLGFLPTISDNPTLLYQQAIRALFKGLENNSPWSTSLETLLLYLDNQFSTAEELLIQLLEKRDQWLPHIFNEQKMQRQHLEQALANINRDVLNELDQAFNPAEKIKLIEILNCIGSAAAVPQDDGIDKLTWLAIAELCLTKENEWRKQLTKNNGFPSELKALKEECLNLIESFKSKPKTKDLLVKLRLLPACEYSDKQWQIIEALMELLPIACAQLRLFFAEHNQIDYIESAQAALQALGDEDNVTDLALSLDYRLKHLLVDEFQDTSISQLRLIEKLTLNWQNDDGRTLFIVGDPMQSIYRFREADVGLFLYVREHGLKELRLIPLTLSSNFRSNKTIIHWINNTFTAAFPSYNDINTAAVSFTPAEAIKTGPGKIGFYNTDNTSKTVIDIIREALQQNPEQSIAILVRAKTHLLPIITALKQVNLSYQAVEIEQLSHRSLIYDALALTKALSHLSDRTAWLSLLKAPFCGLSLTDLTLLMEQITPSMTIWDALSTAQLSTDGQTRLQFILPILTNQLNNRRRQSLSTWVFETWQLLRADRYYTESYQQADLMVFLDLLDQYDEGGDIIDWQNFEISMQQLYANSENNTSPIHIMTMHKAKGLEFDTVILPELHRYSGQNKQQLLLWQERIINEEKSDLLLAPLKSRDETSSQIYSYLKYIEEVKLQNEITRLFYVACTRARNNLHLIASLEENTEGQCKAPDSRSLLATIWPTCRDEFKPLTEKQEVKTTAITKTSKRFTIDNFILR